MNIALTGAELVARWRNGEGQNNPAGPLFAEFAQADIINATAAAKSTRYSICSGSDTIQCC